MILKFVEWTSIHYIRTYNPARYILDRNMLHDYHDLFKSLALWKIQLKRCWDNN